MSDRMRRQQVRQAIDEHHGMVYRLAFRVLRQREDAEDVTQQVFLQLLRHFDSVSADRCRGWLAITALNSARSWVRREQRRREREESYAMAQSERAGTPAAAAEDVTEALGALTEELQLPVLLHYQEGFKYREIATLLRCPEGTVATRIATAKSKLRTQLERSGALAVFLSVDAALAADPQITVPAPLQAALHRSVDSSAAALTGASVTSSSSSGVLLAAFVAVVLIGVTTLVTQLGNDSPSAAQPAATPPQQRLAANDGVADLGLVGANASPSTEAGPVSTVAPLTEADLIPSDATRAGGEIRGRVTDVHGRPVAGARVRLTADFEKDATVTGADGEYRLRWKGSWQPTDEQREAVIDLLADSMSQKRPPALGTGEAPESDARESDPRESAAPEAAAPERAARAAPPAVGSAGWTRSGTGGSSTGGGGTVTIESFRGGRPQRETPTSSSEPPQQRGIPVQTMQTERAGPTVMLSVDAQGFVSRRIGCEGDFTVSHDLELDVTLVVAEGIAGRIRGADGAPLADARVAVFARSGELSWLAEEARDARTAEDGHFQLTGLPQGSYLLRVSASGHISTESRVASGVRNWEQRLQASAELSVHTSLPQESGVRKRLFSVQAVGPAPAERRWFGQRRGHLGDDRHHFDFTGLPAGEYTVAVIGSGSGDFPRAVTTVRLERGSRRQLELPLSGSCDVSGEVIYEQEQHDIFMVQAYPLDDEVRRVRRGARSYRMQSRGNRYTLQSLPAGRYLLTALRLSKGEGDQRIAEVEVTIGAADDTLEIDLLERSYDPATLTVQVRDEVGAPLDEATVRMRWLPTLYTAGRGRTSASGELEFSLRPGARRLLVSCNGYDESALEVELAPGERRHIDVTLRRRDPNDLRWISDYSELLGADAPVTIHGQVTIRSLLELADPERRLEWSAALRRSPLLERTVKPTARSGHGVLRFLLDYYPLVATVRDGRVRLDEKPESR